MDQQSGFLRCNLFLVKVLWKCWNDNKGFRILCKQYNSSRVWDDWLQFWKKCYCGFSSVQFSRSVVSDSLWHESQHARPPCPSPSPEFTQTHVHRVGDATQPSHPLSSPFPPVKYYQPNSIACYRKVVHEGKSWPMWQTSLLPYFKKLPQPFWLSASTPLIHQQPSTLRQDSPPPKRLGHDEGWNDD